MMDANDRHGRNAPERRAEAAALAFDPEKHDAPIVVAAGRGVVAEGILRAAQEAGVPVLPDQNLAHVLTQLSVGDAIPQELYSVVAQVLLFVGRMDKEYGQRLDSWKSTL